VPALAAALAAGGCSREADDLEGITADATVPTLWLRQSVLALTLEADAIGPPEPLEGATVCLRKDDAVLHCTESAADGYFTLDGLAKYSMYVITVRHDGYLPVAEPFIATNIDVDVVEERLTRHVLMLPFGAEAVVGPPGLSLDPERGAIAAFAVDWINSGFAPLAGVTIEVDGPEAAAYFGDGMRHVAGATATVGGYLGASPAASPAAGAPAGAVIWNVEPGLREVSFVHDAQTCQLLGRTAVGCRDSVTGIGCPGRNFFGYPTDRGNTVRVPVLPGFMTRHAGAICLP
jgi:hypothetical protein